MQDWTGNKNSVYKTLGASNHTDKEMQIGNMKRLPCKTFQI